MRSTAAKAGAAKDAEDAKERPKQTSHDNILHESAIGFADLHILSNLYSSTVTMLFFRFSSASPAARLM
jgi:hypothetical protein